jgi:folate-binding protein YgfZ
MHLPQSPTGYDAARQHAAMIRRDRGFIVVSGGDRASYLQGLLTNDTVALKAGEGCYAAYLTPQGRMITDLVIHELGDVMLLALPVATTPAVLARLDQFIFSEDVQLGDVSATWAAVDVIGPASANLLASRFALPLDQVAALAPHGAMRAADGDEPLILRRIDEFGLLAFELVADRSRMQDIEASLRAVGILDLDEDGAEALRVEAGVPRFGRDMDEETIPLEAGIEDRAISFSKGCYVGQEVIIRVLHRGHGRVARKLVGLAWSPTGNVPAVASAILADSKEVGTITSSVWSPALQRPIALAYLKRDFVAPGTHVTTSSGADAEVVPLPFVGQ